MKKEVILYILYKSFKSNILMIDIYNINTHNISIENAKNIKKNSNSCK